MGGVDGDDVAGGGVEGDVEVVGDLGVGEVCEEEGGDVGAAGGGDFVSGLGEGGFEAEFLGEGAGILYIFLGAGAADVVADGVVGEAEIFGDLEV